MLGFSFLFFCGATAIIYTTNNKNTTYQPERPVWKKQRFLWHGAFGYRYDDDWDFQHEPFRMKFKRGLSIHWADCSSRSVQINSGVYRSSRASTGAGSASAMASLVILYDSMCYLFLSLFFSFYFIFFRTKTFGHASIDASVSFGRLSSRSCECALCKKRDLR